MINLRTMSVNLGPGFQHQTHCKQLLEICLRSVSGCIQTLSWCFRMLSNAF